jgi:hypothetical protein
MTYYSLEVGMSTTVFLRIRETQEFGLQGDIYKGL